MTCITDLWVVHSHGFKALAYGSPMGLLWVTHDLTILTHGSPTGHPWAAYEFKVLIHGSPMSHPRVCNPAS